ncbi:tetratricopeptide repeat protein [Rhodospirillum sp. A1_3_36]|uniref:tetratricopeptide repeat protein n=1 Tax=Rhodospirillum sp. A1_3_36 TaxID=3391666 RepID=UPI0039A51AAF
MPVQGPSPAIWIDRPQEAILADWLAAHQSRMTVITGAGGAGKSSLLARFRTLCAEKKVPVALLDLSRFRGTGQIEGPPFLAVARTVHTPKFDAVRRVLLDGPPDGDPGALDAFFPDIEKALAEGQKLTPDMPPLVGAFLVLAVPLAKLGQRVRQVLGNKRKAKVRSFPEKALLEALLEDFSKGGVLLVDTWEAAPDLAIGTRLYFETGEVGARLPSQTDPVPLPQYFGDVAKHLLAESPSLVVAVGRTDIGATEIVGVQYQRHGTMTPFDGPEIHAYLSRALPDLPPIPADLLADIAERTLGNPLWVDYMARTIQDDRSRSPNWSWQDWPLVLERFEKGDRYGLLAFLAQRVTGHDEIWRLAIPHLIPKEDFALFFNGPPPLSIEDYAARGILTEARLPGLFTLHDEVREALRLYAKHNRLWYGDEAQTVRNALTASFDRRTHWTPEENAKIFADFLHPPPETPPALSPLFMEAGYLSLLADSRSHALSPNIDPEVFWKKITENLSLTVKQKRHLLQRAPELSPFQIRSLLDVFEEERSSLNDLLGPELAREIATMSSKGELPQSWENNEPFLLSLLEKLGENAVLLTYLGSCDSVPQDERYAYFNRALAVAPKNADTLGNFAVFMETVRKDMDEAENLYKRAIEADPKHADTLGNFAVFMETVRKDMDEAEDLYKRAIEADPKHANTLGNFADFMETVREDMDEAENLYKRAIEADPKHANNLGNFADFMETVRGDMDEAEVLYKRAIEADPKHATALGNFANFMRTVHGDMDKAEDLYKRATEADPKHATALESFALFMKNVRRDMDRAEDLYKRAIEADPKHANTLRNFALFKHTVRGDMDEAEDLYKKAIEADPKHATTLGNFANFMHTVRKDMDEAEDLYKRAIETDPKHANTLGNFAVLMHTARGNMDEAEDLYKRAIEADPKHAKNLGNFANFMHTVRRDMDKAEDLYKRAIKADPKHANTLGNFAGFCFSQGRMDEGRDLIVQAWEGEGRFPSLDLELSFYACAHGPDVRLSSLGMAKKLILDGVRSPGWDLSGNTARARDDGHPWPDLLDTLAAVITEETPAEALDAFAPWREATPIEPANPF